MVKKNKLQQFIIKLLPHRLWVQTAFLLVWLDPLAVRMHTMCSPVFHCYACPLATFACPIGVIAQFSALHMFPFVAVGLLILVGSLLGSLICGWICPFGLLQDLAAKVPTPRLKIPNWMGYFRYMYAVRGRIVDSLLFSVRNMRCLSAGSVRRADWKKPCRIWRPPRFKAIRSRGRMR